MIVGVIQGQGDSPALTPVILEMDRLADVGEVNTFLSQNAGHTIYIKPHVDGAYNPNFLETGDPFIIPAGTTVEALGKVTINSNNPTRPVFHLGGDRARLLGAFTLVGNYVRPVFDADPGDWTDWATTWNAAHPAYALSDWETKTWEQSWDAKNLQSLFESEGALGKVNRASAITSYDASELLIDGLTIINFHTGVCLQGMNIIGTSAEDTPTLQTYGNVIRNLTVDQFDFGILAKKQRNFTIDNITSEWLGHRVNHAQPHVVYLSNSSVDYEESWNVNVGTVTAYTYEGGSVFKARACKNLTWKAINCYSVHSAVSINEGCTGIGGDVIVTDQHATADNAGSRFAINVVNAPGFVFGGTILIQQRAGEDTMKGWAVENSTGVRFLQGCEITCSRATDEGYMFRVRSCSEVHSGPIKYTDTNNRNAQLATLSDDLEEGGNASDCVMEFIEVVGTQRLVKFVGLSSRNQVWADPTKVGDWDPDLALVDDSLGGGNVLIDPRATSLRTVQITESLNLGTKASSTLTIERDGPDPEDEDALPAPRLFSNNDTITFAGRIYTWKTTLTGAANEIRIPGSWVSGYPLMTADYGYLQIAFLNATVFAGDPDKGLYKSVGAGVIYGTGTLAHTLVESEWGGNQFNIRSKSGGTASNAYTTTVSMTGGYASWTGSTLSGGGDPDSKYLNAVLEVTTGATDVTLTLPTASLVDSGNRIEAVKVSDTPGDVLLKDSDATALATITTKGQTASLSPDSGAWLSDVPADVRNTGLPSRSLADDNLYFLVGNIGSANQGALRAERMPFSALKTDASSLDIQADSNTWQIVDPSKNVRTGHYYWNLSGANKIYDLNTCAFGEIYEFCTKADSTSTLFLGTEGLLVGVTTTAGSTIEVPGGARIALRRQTGSSFYLIDYTPTADGAFRYASIALTAGALNDTTASNLFRINRLDSSSGTGPRIRTTNPDTDGEWMIFEKSSNDTNFIAVEIRGSGTDVAWLTSQGDRVTLRVRSGAWEVDSYQIAPRFDLYTSSATWTKPPLASHIEGQLIPGGAGGGSGRCGDAGTARTGGNGGNGASLVRFTRKASDLDSTVSVVVGTGGAGGASTSTINTSNAGAPGVVTTFGSSGAIYHAYTTAPAGGLGGGTAANTQTAATFQGLNAATGAFASVTPWTGVDGSTAWGMGGASGGGISTANAYSIGGRGLSSINGLTNAAGTAGSAGVAGGAGGSAVAATAQVGGFHPAPSGGGGGSGEGGGNGGNGGGYGGAGGGGGASLTGTASGAGGNGANGAALIITYFGG